MKKCGKILSAVLLLVLPAASAVFAADARKATKFEKMLAPRTIVCWIGGVELGGLMIGSQAKMTFVCLDRKLGAEMTRLRPDERDGAEYDSVPGWLRESGNYYMKQKGRTFFAVQVSAAKSWNLELDKIRVGDYTVAKEDAQIGLSMGNFFRKDSGILALPGGCTGEFGFYVPSELLKPGAQLQVGYGDNLESWTVPKN